MARRRKGDPIPTGDRKTLFRQNIDKTNEVLAKQLAVAKELITKFKKTHKKKGPKIAAFPEAYLKSGCNKAQAARAVGVGRRSVTRWLEKYPDLKEIIDDIDESLIDLSESALVTHILDGNAIANIFHLKTKGRSRGYIEQPKSMMGGVNGTGGASFSEGLELVKEQIKNSPRLLRKIEEVLTD